MKDSIKYTVYGSTFFPLHHTVFSSKSLKSSRCGYPRKSFHSFHENGNGCFYKFEYKEEKGYLSISDTVQLLGRIKGRKGRGREGGKGGKTVFE